MRAERFQTTLAGPCSVSGRGYWSGESTTLTFIPASPNTGIQFVRADLPGKPRANALSENRVSMQLRTCLARGAARFEMIEHVMAALYGLQIDNVEIHCTAAEMPGMDGSSLPYCLALTSVGTTQLPEARQRFRIVEPIHVGDADRFVRVEPVNQDVLEVEYQLDFGPASPIGQATYNARLQPESFATELAPARTFIAESEALALQHRGIAMHVTNRDLLVFNDQGPINNQLRFQDECARHKALDLVGDLALSGIDLVGRFVARRSGHQLNGQVAELLRQLYLQRTDSSNQDRQFAA